MRLFHPRRIAKPLLAFCILLLASEAGWAQSYPLAITDRAIENPYVLHPRDWPNQLGLRDPVIMRTNAGERWFQIETARGVFSPTFGNLLLLYTGSSAGCGLILAMKPLLSGELDLVINT